MSYQKDYYAILQVSRNASQEEIERAYQRLSALYDPKTSQKNRAAQRHADIQEAYSVLSSRGARREHDKTLTKSLAAAGSMSPSEVISNRFILLSAGIIIISIGVILVAVLALAGGGDDDTDTANDATSLTPLGTGPTASAPPTPLPTPTGPTPTAAPATPPEISGEPITTDSGLQYIEIIPGTGSTPAVTDRVLIHYSGWLAPDGPKFDASVDRGTPYESTPGGFIAGFTEGLLLMKEGGTSRFIIPAALGYGEAGSGASIPPNSDLIFDVTLLTVSPVATTAATATPAATPTPAESATVTATATP